MGMGRRLGTLALATAAVMALAGPGTALADGEYEPNDSLTQTAGPLGAGINYEATQDTDNDVDWYRFYIRGQVQLTITGTVLSDGYSTCELTLRDDAGDSINYGTIQTGNYRDIRETLYRPGVYYLVVECHYTGDRYRFTLSPGDATVSEVCGIALGNQTDAQENVSKAENKVAKAEARKRHAHGRRAKQRARAKLRQALGLLANEQTRLAGWDAAVAANC